ncbi:MAG TPA: hypothetical protein VF540_13445 [Segetibacter sp.]
MKQIITRKEILCLRVYKFERGFMKRIGFRLLITFFTLTLGIVVTFALFNFRSQVENLYDDLPILDYCELANNLEKYDGKIVRINAKLYGYTPKPRFLDDNCYGKEKEAVVIFTNKEQSRRIYDNVEIDQMKKANDLWLALPKILAVGKFTQIKESQNINSENYGAALKFEVLKLEKITQ